MGSVALLEELDHVEILEKPAGLGQIEMGILVF
jgi:hypothetical protein